MHGIISELSARDTNAKAVEGQAVGGVPCKLNNEKHEQTPWTILILSCSMNVEMRFFE